jgi:hypothetical protein
MRMRLNGYPKMVPLDAADLAAVSYVPRLYTIIELSMQHLINRLFFITSKASSHLHPIYSNLHSA